MKTPTLNLRHTYKDQLAPYFYDPTVPTPVKDPECVVINYPLARSLGLALEDVAPDDLAAFFSGNRLPPGSRPIAQAYAGHQYGHFTMLGDGRAVLLGEQVAPDNRLVDIQLKGSGRTKYSRGGDGRAVLGPMLREYLMSESLFALGVPTSRSLAVVTTGEPVWRESEKKGAVLTRVALSHIRVGTFEFAAASGEASAVKMLADYAMKRHYPEIADGRERYRAFLRAVIGRQARLVAQWMSLGFVHGVMNTDNMSIAGETIDYGPCAFLDVYDPSKSFSSIDHHGRYSFQNQPRIALWNLARFAETLLPLLDPDEERAVAIANEEVGAFEERYRREWLAIMHKKIGLTVLTQQTEKLIDSLLEIMRAGGMDYHQTFRDLSRGETSDRFPRGLDPALDAWLREWRGTTAVSKELMLGNNPAVVPRNGWVEDALREAEENDNFRLFERLLAVLSSPFSDPAEGSEFCKIPPADPGYRTFCGT
jgi:serine/tyrosine/threonine adenylyltransferase